MATMERLTWRPILIVFSFLLMIGLGITLWNTRDFSDKSLSDSGLPISMALEDIELLHCKNGRQEWQLYAQESYYYKEFETIEFVEPRFIYSLPNKREQLKVLAPHGEYIQKKGKIRLWPQVSAYYGQTEFKAQGMEFKLDQKLFRFVGKVSLKQSESEVQSQSGFFDINKNLIVFKENVEVTINAPLFGQSTNME